MHPSLKKREKGMDKRKFTVAGDDGNSEKDLSLTQHFKVHQDEESVTKKILSVVYEALTEKGYDPVNQIVGYIMSGDPTYITSYENAPANYNASLQLSFGFPIKAIGCIFNTGLSGNWDKTPSYVNDALIYTQNLRPGLSLGIRSNFSRDIRFNINGNGSYVSSWNSAGSRTEYFTEAIRAGFELNNIFKVMYLGGNYTKTFMQGVEYMAVNDNILDLNGGFRFGPRNNVDVSFMIHDLFNKTRGFSTSMSTDYVNNRWTHNFGRYVMLTLAYRFNSMGGGNGGGRGR